MKTPAARGSFHLEPADWGRHLEDPDTILSLLLACAANEPKPEPPSSSEKEEGGGSPLGGAGGCVCLPL